MFDPMAPLQDVIENVKLEVYLGLLQSQTEALELFRVLLNNGCPPKAVNAAIEYQMAKEMPKMKKNEDSEDGCL